MAWHGANQPHEEPVISTNYLLELFEPIYFYLFRPVVNELCACMQIHMHISMYTYMRLSMSVLMYKLMHNKEKSNKAHETGALEMSVPFSSTLRLAP